MGSAISARDVRGWGVAEREYLLNILFNAYAMVCVLVFFNEQTIICWLAIESIFIDFIFCAEYLQNRKVLTPEAYSLRLSRFYFPFEILLAAALLYLLCPRFFFPIQLLLTLLMLLYNHRRLGDQRFVILIAGLTSGALALALVGPAAVSVKGTYLCSGAGCVGLCLVLFNRLRQHNPALSLQCGKNHAAALVNDQFFTYPDVLYKISAIVESRSQETGNHVQRVAEYCRILAEGYKLDSHVSNLIAVIAPLHDIGKLGIPEAILSKPGVLTGSERQVIEQHPVMGYNMLKRSRRELFQYAAVIANEHHERYDGSGYPRGKQAEEIHLFGRIAALADVFDALCSDRCYKKAWAVKDVLDYVHAGKGKEFDPVLTDIFFGNLDKLLKVQRAFADSRG
jgi:HD-GYP domain-containing protein (c-di-GMP phosphodiesterase class II)